MNFPFDGLDFLKPWEDYEIERNHEELQKQFKQAAHQIFKLRNILP